MSKGNFSDEFKRDAVRQVRPALNEHCARTIQFRLLTSRSAVR